MPRTEPKPVPLADALPALRAQWRKASARERAEIERTAAAVEVLQAGLGGTVRSTRPGLDSATVTV
jgi:hypothetical protein